MQREHFLCVTTASLSQPANFHLAELCFNTEYKAKCIPFSRWHFQIHFLEWKCMSLIQISLNFVPKGPINNIPALFQIMAWCRQATSHYLKQWWSVYWHIYAPLSLNELMRHRTKSLALSKSCINTPCLSVHLSIHLSVLHTSQGTS